MSNQSDLTIIDLFCGCGGFSLGMERAGFHCLASIDFNKEAIATYRANFPRMPADRVRCEDLTQFRPEALAKIIGTDEVDVIAGGPPCQGFSLARQRDGANHGDKRFIADPRRYLYREFLRYVEFFKPRVFVMENVLGIQSASGGDYFTRVQHEARQLGYRVVAQIADAFALGVPQKRKRQLFIGVRADVPGFFPPSLAPAPNTTPNQTLLGHAIDDLPSLSAGAGVDLREYDVDRRVAHIQKYGAVARKYLINVLQIGSAKSLTAHVARPHSERDLRDFARLREGETSVQAMRRGVEFEYPYDKSTFKDRYTRQSRSKPCSTIVAHLSKDGLMFVHPTQNRSLTPREAARIQSFPDWFQFPVPRTHQYRVIGNAVPPLVAEAVGWEVQDFLRSDNASRERATGRANKHMSNELIPQSQTEAAARLQTIARLDNRSLKACDKSLFLEGWFALFYLFPGLHPDNALDHGEVKSLWAIEDIPLPGFEQFANRFERSGWPVALEALGREAWRRFERDELDEDEFYCAEAQRRGLCAKDVRPSRGVRTRRVAQSA